MHSPELINLLERACKVDLHFAHRFYFYINSLCMGSSLKVVESYLDRLSKIMVEKWRVIVAEELLGNHLLVDRYNQRQLKDGEQPSSKLIVLQVHNLYKSIHQPERLDSQSDNIFQPTIAFISDLVILSERLFTKTNKREYLVEELRKINMLLPARISLPLYKSNHSFYLKTQSARRQYWESYSNSLVSSRQKAALPFQSACRYFRTLLFAKA